MHLCSPFVGEGRGVHTQVDHSLISRPSLLRFPSLAVPTESWVGTWEQGCFQTYKYAKVIIGILV